MELSCFALVPNMASRLRNQAAIRGRDEKQ
jgi:hypothetical protein